MANNTYDSGFYDFGNYDDNSLYDAPLTTANGVSKGQLDKSDLVSIEKIDNKGELIRDDNIDITSSFNYDENN